MMRGKHDMKHERAKTVVAFLLFSLIFSRETLANFFGGISLLLDRPFTTGNYIIPGLG